MVDKGSDWSVVASTVSRMGELDCHAVADGG